MRVRQLEERDIPTLRMWHLQSGFDYPFPNLLSDEFERVSVVVDEDDRPVMALPARRSIEMYLLMDKQWRTPRWRLEALLKAHEEMRVELDRRGYHDVNAWLPPEVERSFGKRLVKLFGWTKSRWQSYSRRVKDE